ncbi:MAG: type II toxin-antitoxin system YoeB family toxin [Holophagales bacterium]|jgi:Txe/YoeB family toxin of Txe-Axe toxin-antitoxin module|nr:type II toxin-antitoxin system YoeB family toxin [Holophagales bacterium]
MSYTVYKLKKVEKQLEEWQKINPIIYLAIMSAIKQLEDDPLNGSNIVKLKAEQCWYYKIDDLHHIIYSISSNEVSILNTNRTITKLDR